MRASPFHHHHWHVRAPFVSSNTWCRSRALLSLIMTMVVVMVMVMVIVS